MTEAKTSHSVVTEFLTNIRPRCQSTAQCTECSSEVRHGSSGKVVEGAGGDEAEAGLVEEDAGSARSSGGASFLLHRRWAQVNFGKMFLQTETPLFSGLKSS